jgi:hypothetical protein
MKSNLIAERAVVRARCRRIPRRRRLAVVAGLAAVLCCGRAPAQNSASEYQVKAAFLFNFAKFIDWPPGSFAGPQSPFSICILGADPFGKAIDQTLRGQTIRGRAVVVLRMQDPAQLRHCRMGFVSASEQGRLPRILQAIRGSSVLLVGESPGFAAAGGMIQFQMQDNRIRFSINPDAAERAGLRLSSQLLALATIIHDPSEKGSGR